MVVTTACVLAVAALAAAFIWPFTDLIAAHDVGATVHAAALQTAREAVRTQLITLGAGLFAAGALVYTARNFGLSRRTYELTEQGQVTDRYTKAIEQLGSAMLDVRIGGIYALERVAYDSFRDHSTVMEVLTAFVREHSSEHWPPAAPGSQPPERGIRPDVQAAVSVIGRRESRRDIMSIDLRGADLTRANVADAELVGAELVGVILAEADLSGAHLRSANLSFANLAKANLADADLTSADLVNASLVNASLVNASLRHATFTGANLAGADLGSADCYRADFRGADLASADVNDAKNINSADLTFAFWPPDAVVPEGWQRDTLRGTRGRLKRSD